MRITPAAVVGRSTTINSAYPRLSLLAKTERVSPSLSGSAGVRACTSTAHDGAALRTCTTREPRRSDASTNTRWEAPGQAATATYR